MLQDQIRGVELSRAVQQSSFGLIPIHHRGVTSLTPTYQSFRSSLVAAALTLQSNTDTDSADTMF